MLLPLWELLPLREADAAAAAAAAAVDARPPDSSRLVCMLAGMSLR